MATFFYKNVWPLKVIFKNIFFKLLYYNTNNNKVFKVKIWLINKYAS